MKKQASLVLGFVFLALAALGVFLPLLPTTPFLLCSAYFFSKHSDRFHKWLLDLPWAGNVIKDWEKSRSVKKSTKILALTMIVVATAASYYSLMDKHFAFRLLLILLTFIGVTVILKLKTKSV